MIRLFKFILAALVLLSVAGCASTVFTIETPNTSQGKVLGAGKGGAVSFADRLDDQT